MTDIENRARSMDKVGVLLTLVWALSFVGGTALFSYAWTGNTDLALYYASSITVGTAITSIMMAWLVRATSRTGWSYRLKRLHGCRASSPGTESI